MPLDIEFIPRSQDILDYFEPPKPAVEITPLWFKESSIYVNANRVQSLNATKDVKACASFADTLSSGYILVTPCDVEVVLIEGNLQFLPSSRFLFQFAVVRGPKVENVNQGFNMPFPEDCFPIMFAWSPMYGIKTPKGYSVIITQPFNRFDLPFVTTQGIIDSDKYHLAGEIPFFIKRSAIGSVIPKGTPIAQIIPFKRTDWKSSLNKDFKSINMSNVKQSFVDRFYKRNLWQKKTYQ
jgi:hypothetical protein